ncbi:MAG TPA: ABC transporter permease [Gemmatimonadaceae bacterium]|nr:ABC transporter permease [Gemmatimonadaceae bacterium]
MTRIPGVRRLFRVRGTRASVEREVDDELRFHLEARAEALIASGLTADEAHEQAVREFGDVHDARAELVALDRRQTRRHRMREWGEAIAFDLRYAVRGLRAQPALAAGIVLTLALGIGANATMFGVVDRLVLGAPAHWREPGQLEQLYFATSYPDRSVTSAFESYPAYLAFRDSVPAFQDVAAFSDQYTMTSGRGAAAVQVRARLVTANFLRTVGAHPALGRFFTDEEARPPAGAPVVVLGYGFWQSRFGSDSTVLGRTIPLGKGRYTIIGVAPKGLTTTDLLPVDVWLPVAAAGPEQLVWNVWTSNARAPWLQIVARLRSGADDQKALAQSGTVYHRVTAEHDRLLRRGSTGPSPTYSLTLDAVSGVRYFNGARTLEARVSRWLIGVSAIVLLIACANVANLLLARATRRRREIAVRLALGVSRHRLVGHLMVESVLLAVVGGSAGLLIAEWGGVFMRGVLLPGVVWNGSPVNARVLMITAAIVLVTGVLIGLAPALQATHTSLTPALKAGASEGARRTRLRSALIVAQAALSVVLLVGAGLFARSLWNARSVNVGMNAHPVLLATVDLQSAGHTPADQAAFMEQAMQRLGALPGVEDVAIAESMAFETMSGPWSILPRVPVVVPGRRDSIPGRESGVPFFNVVSPGYFATVGARIISGRGFGVGDRANTQHVAVINETMARSVWPGEDPLGKCVRMGRQSACTTIVGVVTDTRVEGIYNEPGMQLFVPFGQARGTARVLFIRTRGDPAQLEGQVRHTLLSVMPNIPYADVRPVQELLDPQFRSLTLGATMFGVFALLALVVASVGLYSVLAYDVAQRVHEMGVRVALGARPTDVIRLIVGEGVRLVAVGIVLGLVATLAAGRAIASLLFATSPHDPIMLGVVCVTLLVVALAASVLPAWRATRVDPNVALRTE